MNTEIQVTKHYSKIILKELLNKSKHTEEEFSERMGIPKKVVTEWLNGEQVISLNRILVFAEKLEYDIRFIITKR